MKVRHFLLWKIDKIASNFLIGVCFLVLALVITESLLIIAQQPTVDLLGYLQPSKTVQLNGAGNPEVLSEYIIALPTEPVNLASYSGYNNSCQIIDQASVTLKNFSSQIGS